METIITYVLKARTNDWQVFKAFGGTDASSGAVREEGLKKLYLRAALKVHPDKCTDSRAAAAFQRLSAAHDNLVDRIRQGQAVGGGGGGGAGAGAAGAGGAGAGSGSTRTEGDCKWQTSATAGSNSRKAVPRWYEGATWNDIAAALEKEEQSFAAELAAEIAVQQQQKGAQQERRAAKRKLIDARVNEGLEGLKAKYRIKTAAKPTSSSSGGGDGGGRSGAPCPAANTGRPPYAATLSTAVNRSRSSDRNSTTFSNKQEHGHQHQPQPKQRANKPTDPYSGWVRATPTTADVPIEASAVAQDGS
jgi:hypothetical protein